MKNLIRISRLAGILIAALALAPAPLADEGAFVAPSEPVRVAQAENKARYDNPRPMTVGDLYRFQDQVNERMNRLEDKIEHLGGRLDLALTVMLGGLLGIVAILLARREKPRASARPSPAADKTPPAPAH